ncbi:MAG: hypothetical protein Q8P05_05015 [Candidatus Diapherotrites archaeon]|nr:hypothetical protein [Candidatus Diapherotrites archaeon]MDZ4256475.1 hypothetical protein [archaeon]
MRIYVAHASGFDFRTELYNPLRNSSLNQIHDIILPHERDGEPASSRDIIPTCHYVLAEVSYPSTGLGIELGWADHSGVQIICLYRKGNAISSSLRIISNIFIEYADASDMIDKIGKALGE